MGVKIIKHSLEEAKAYWVEIPLHGSNKNLIGQKFKSLTPAYRTEGAKTSWVCRCDCGNYIKIRYDHLQDLNRNFSCGSCPLHKKSFCIYKYVENDKIVYIGKTMFLKKRIIEHTQDKLKDFHGDIYYFECDKQIDMDFLEYVLINKYHPIYNIEYKNEKIQTDMKEPEWHLYKGDN